LIESDNHLGTEPEGTTFVGGIAEFVVIEFDTPANMEMVFTGGETYDLAVVIDYDGDDEYSSGIDYMTFQSVLVDGNTTLELVYPIDFFLAP
jgi:hypothetical protein